MKPLWRCITISTFVAAPLVLTGCAQVNTARQWWQVWRNPVTDVSPAALSSSKVIIDLQKIAQHHPAWKLAEQLESSPSTNLSLNWSRPQALSSATLISSESTFSSSNANIVDADFAEPEQLLMANEMEVLAAQMTQQQRAAWKQWEDTISVNLQEDRQQIGRAMRVDLRDQIDQTQKNIPEIESPFIPSAEIQREMINLRLKLLQNLALSPEDKESTKQRLDQLNEQWTKQLRQQAQQGAEAQRYWRETVPRQMQETGEAQIQQTLQTLQQQDQTAIDLTINSQQQWLEQDQANNTAFLLQLPLITNQATRTESTFRTPLVSSKTLETRFNPINAPEVKMAGTSKASQAEIIQLKQIALTAAKNAAAQSASRHQWKWSAKNKQQSTKLNDVTAIVLREANFY